VQNPHPLVVHFPLALLLVSAAAALWGTLRRAESAAAFARALLYLGTLACAVAVVTGFLAAQSVTRVQRALDTVSEHQNFAYALLALACLLSGWAFVAAHRLRRAPGPRALWLAGQLALATLVVLTGKEGGELVHRFGVGTALTARGGPLFEAPAPAPGATAGTAADSTSPHAPPRPSGRDFR